MKTARVFVTKNLGKIELSFTPYLSRYGILCKDNTDRPESKILKNTEVLKARYFDTCILIA